MGVDYLYFEALRGTTVAKVRRAIVEEMAVEGFVTAKQRDANAIEIEVEEREDWICVNEIRDKSPIEWAERLARSLDALGVSARSWSDFDGLELRRYDGKDPNGALSFGAETKVKRLKTAFLADLAPPKNQRKLRAGLDPAGRRSDDLLIEIGGLAGLPKPNDRYGFGGRQKGSLYFTKPQRPVPAGAKPVVRVRKVRFETSFHVRGIGTSEIVAAIAKVHGRSGLKVVSEAKKPKRQLFVREWQGWTSFAEVVHDGKDVDWAKVLSAPLAKPVLSVFAGDATVEVAAVVKGRVVGRARADQKDTKLVVDGSLLEPFGVKKKPLSVKLPDNPFIGGSDPRFLAEILGNALVLETPILSGSIKGEVIDFR